MRNSGLEEAQAGIKIAGRLWRIHVDMAKPIEYYKVKK